MDSRKKKELKQKVSEAFTDEQTGTSSQHIRDLIDEFIPDEELSQKGKAIACIKALSRIEGYTMASEGLKRTPMLYDNIDYLMEYFSELLVELDK